MTLRRDDMSFEGSYELLAIASLGISNLLVLWIRKTTDKFYTTLHIEASSGPTFEQCDLNTMQQGPIVSATVDIDRCESCGIDCNPLERSVIHPTIRGDEIIEVNGLQPRVDLIPESSSMNEVSNESKQDLPPTYQEIISSNQNHLMFSPPTYRDAMKNERAIITTYL